MGETLELEEAVEQEFELIPHNTIVEAKVSKVVLETTKMIDDKTGDPVKQYVFTFVIQDEPYDGRLAWGRTSNKFVSHENCRLRNWTMAILAVDTLVPGFKFDPETDLAGLNCRILLEVNTYVDKKATAEQRLTGKIGEDEEVKKSNNRVVEVLHSGAVRGQSVTAEEPF